MSKKFAVADCETDPFLFGRVPAPFIWGFFDGVEYKEFYDTLDFLAFVIDKPLIVYAHNGGKFDWHFLIRYIPAYEPIKIISGRLAAFRIGECEFRDSYNIIPIALSQYKKDDIDYSLMEESERDKPENKKKISDYLRGDCVYLYELVARYIADYGVSLTQAGAAMRLWSDISGRRPPKDDGGKLYAAFSPYYYGGRCEVFHHGEFTGKFHGADINSAYPFAMLSRHPIGLDYFPLSLSDWAFLPEAERGACFFNLTGPARGAFPLRGLDKSLRFPSDESEQEFLVTGWEYQAASDLGLLTGYAATQIYCFHETTDFANYILPFYSLRKRAKAKGDNAGDIFCKLFMNSLYGKFGANPDNYQNYMTLPPHELGEGEYIHYEFCSEFGENNYLVSRELRDDEKNYYNVATSASITGYVRAMLLRAIHGASGVLYCDTDSLYSADLGALTFGAGLGEWEYLGEYDHGAFCGRKLYTVRETDGEYKVRSKGARLSHIDLLRIARGDVVLYNPDAPTFSVNGAPRFISRKIKFNY